MSKGGLNEFLAELFKSEGGGEVNVENRYGYIGKYQFGEDALVDLGYYKADGTINRTVGGKFKYDWVGQWTGKNGATSKDIFLSSSEIQDQAAKDWVSFLCKGLRHYKLDKYLGQTVGGLEVTESGIIAAAHLKGFGNSKRPGVIAFLRSEGKVDAADANGTKVSDYMHKFAGYSLGCGAKCAVHMLDREKQPVVGLEYKLLTLGKEIYRGLTDALGKGPFVGGFSAGQNIQILVKKLEGGYKSVGCYTAKHSPATITLISPKLLAECKLEQHAGPPGAHKGIAVAKLRAVRQSGRSKKRQSGKQRNASGNPVTVLAAPAENFPVQDRIKRLQEILLRNVTQGAKNEPLSGPAAVMKVLRNERISTREKRVNLSLGRCYMYVKIALQASGLVSRYLVGEHAKDAGSELLKEGFRNLLDDPNHGLDSPQDAPFGAVIVYGTTDGSPHGHIEVRLETSGTPFFASDYVSDNPRCQVRSGTKTLVGRGRKTTGIWVKE